MIDLNLLDRVVQKVESTQAGTFLRAYDGATVINEVELSSSKVPGEINDLMLLQRTAIAYGVDSFVGSKVNPLTGGIRYVINGPLVSGEWVTTPSVFKLIMNGTGAMSLDSRDANGAVTTGVFSKTLSTAINEVGFPYAGDSAMAIRATFPQEVTVEVI